MAITTKAKDKLLAQMPEALQEIAEKIRDKWAAEAHSDLLMRYEVGIEVNKTKGKERKYGERVIPQLAEFLGEETNALRACQKFVEVWPTKGEFRTVIERTNNHGGLLTFSHLELIAALAPKDRQRMLTLFHNEAISAREMVRQMQERRGGKTSNNAGIPTTPESGLTRLVKFSDLFLEQGPIFDKGIFVRLNTIKPEQVKPELLELIRVAKQKQEALEKLVISHRRKLDVAEEKIRNILAAKQRETEPSRLYRGERPELEEGEVLLARKGRSLVVARGYGQTKRGSNGHAVRSKRRQQVA